MTNSSEYDQLDDLDRMILTELSLDGRMSLTALAKKLGISKTPCSVRVGRLVSEGVIVGFRAVLDPIEYARTLENLPSIHARPKKEIDSGFACRIKHFTAVCRICLTPPLHGAKAEAGEDCAGSGTKV